MHPCIAGLTGRVVMDEHAARLPSYWVWQVTPDNMDLHVYAELAGVRARTQVCLGRAVCVCFV